MMYPLFQNNIVVHLITFKLTNTISSFLSSFFDQKNNLLLLIIIYLVFGGECVYGQALNDRIIYVKKGDTLEICDNRTTSIYAYEYKSLDSKKSLIIEPEKNVRYTNPYKTSLLQIHNVIEDDTGYYKCPEDDMEWKHVEVYIPIKHVSLANLHPLKARETTNCPNCLTVVDDESLDVYCGADGYPKPEIDVYLDKNGTSRLISSIAGGKKPDTINELFKPSSYEAYRIQQLTPEDNGRWITCEADLTKADKTMKKKVSKQLYIEFRPVCAEKSKKINSGINQTRTVNCTVLRANPPYITYEISNSLSNSIIRRISSDQNDNLYYIFEITPTNIEQFRPFNVTARNSVGVPDAITNCSIEVQFNVTIQIKCQKSYAQGDNDGYTCVLFKYKPNEAQLFEEIARSKSCIFAFDYFFNSAEYRVSAFNKYGTLPVSTYGYPVYVNRREAPKQSSFFSIKAVIIISSVIGGIILLLILCCCCCGNRLKSKDRKYQGKYPRSSSESEPMKPNSDDSISTSHLTQNGTDKRLHPNGSAVYDVPGLIAKDTLTLQQTPSTSIGHYHQQQNGNIHYIDNDSLNSSLNSLPTRTRTFANKVYSMNEGIDNKYGPLSEDYGRPEEILEVDEDSPVYSTTTDIMSESGSFLVPSSSSKKRAPPPPKPRYSTLRSVRSNSSSMMNNNPNNLTDDKTLPLPKPRSRSNSRTRLNGGNDTPNSSFYDERPISSSDSGVCDVVCLPNGDTIRSGLVRSRQQNLQKHYTASHFQQIPQPSSQKTLPNHNTVPSSFNHQSLISPIVRGTEC
ncbi:unnamed protein product [Didymodactylos carnosus]|uniref:Ig-like domain-containing protein n=1 Tax=Didymodactylos carnosus TaxID=1234261 RepID=A0A813ZEL7_9BILA|nr:unnamed protein product [Didymodactylos carnosus]CAF0897634.1 unnamed protein product [Didymodactylos carnosus]CAF3515062.1 unnamed protein product [Didymodactylos carnosus]CAF3680635.1 unnamed protein product [Didymodactylos carnosus]